MRNLLIQFFSYWDFLKILVFGPFRSKLLNQIYICISIIGQHNKTSTIWILNCKMRTLQSSRKTFIVYTFFFMYSRFFFFFSGGKRQESHHIFWTLQIISGISVLIISEDHKWRRKRQSKICRERREIREKKD